MPHYPFLTPQRRQAILTWYVFGGDNVCGCVCVANVCFSGEAGWRAFCGEGLVEGAGMLYEERPWRLRGGGSLGRRRRGGAGGEREREEGEGK